MRANDPAGSEPPGTGASPAGVKGRVVALEANYCRVQLDQPGPHGVVRLLCTRRTRLAKIGLQVAERLAAQGIGATVIDPRWVVPVPRSVIDISAEHRIVVTIEDGVRVGGIGTRIRQDLRAAGVDTAVTELGLPDEFLPHGSRDFILEQVGLTPQTIARDVVAQVLGSKIPIARPLPDESVAEPLREER